MFGIVWSAAPLFALFAALHSNAYTPSKVLVMFPVFFLGMTVLAVVPEKRRAKALISDAVNAADSHNRSDAERESIAACV